MRQKTNRKGLIPKQQIFVKEVLKHPSKPYSAAAEVAYNIENKDVAKSIARQNLRKPAIISALDQSTRLVEDTLITTVKDWGRADKPRQREIAQQAAMYIHDKVHGKATQRIEQKSESITINIDLSQD